MPSNETWRPFCHEEDHEPAQPRITARGKAATFFLGGLIGTQLGGLIAFLAIGDAIVWVAAAVTFVGTQTIGIYLISTGAHVGPRRALLWIAILIVMAASGTGLFFFIRGALGQ